MKTHIPTFLLLTFAAISFVVGFFVKKEQKQYCDIVAFSLPTIAAVVEVCLAKRSNKTLRNQLSKRPIWNNLSQDDYDKLKAEGKLNDDEYYATFEE